MVPTVLESLGIDAPTEIRGVAQSPIEGVSLAHIFNDAEAPTNHHTQYFEMFAHRSIYHDGWRAVCPFPGTSFAEAGVSFGMLELTEDKLRELDATGWELYNVEVDPAETNNLAEQERAKLIEMIALWYTEAGKYNVLPLDSRGTMRFADERPQIAGERDTYVYFPRTQAVPENVAAKVLNRAHTITVDAELDGRRRGRVGLPRQQCRWLRLVRAGRQAALRAQLRRRRGTAGVVGSIGAARKARAELRIRADWRRLISRTARAHRARPSSSSTVKSSARRTSR